MLLLLCYHYVTFYERTELANASKDPECSHDVQSAFLFSADLASGCRLLPAGAGCTEAGFHQQLNVIQFIFLLEDEFSLVSFSPRVSFREISLAASIRANAKKICGRL